MTPMIAAAAVVVLLLVALLLSRRRSRAEPAPADSADAEPATASSADEPGEFGLDRNEWRRAGALDYARAAARGGRAALALRRSPATVFIADDGETVRVAASHEAPYGGRPNWDHIAALTLVMAKAERCWPGADLRGILRYTDTIVPVEYSPSLVADLEDNTAPSSLA